MLVKREVCVFLPSFWIHLSQFFIVPQLNFSPFCGLTLDVVKLFPYEIMYCFSSLFIELFLQQKFPSRNSFAALKLII